MCEKPFRVVGLNDLGLTIAPVYFSDINKAKKYCLKKNAPLPIGSACEFDVEAICGDGLWHKLA